MSLYKVQYRDQLTDSFQDDGKWATCEECVTKLRALRSADETREVRVIDEHGVVIATTQVTADPSETVPRST